MKRKQLRCVFSICLVLGPGSLASEPWVAGPEMLDRSPETTEIRGVVFHDLNRDGRHQPDESGIPDVLVTNGLSVVRTNAEGRYVLPLRDDMDLSVVQPAGWQLPTNESHVPQFSYTHKPAGSARALRYGGLPPTGDAPGTINFPLIPASGDGRFRAAVIGDSQTYSNTELGYLRDSTLLDLVKLEGGRPDLLLYVGDLVGDDLNLLPRLFRLGGAVGAPQFAVVGNHDIDLDADRYADSADTWRRLFGPAYYAFEREGVIFIALNNVYFPVDSRGRATYNGLVDETQLTWLENLLEHVPEDKLVVLAHHIPFVSFVDSGSSQHQTDNLPAIHGLLEGRPALSLSGHTHTIENHSPGQTFAGWKENTGIEALPFRHIVAGAASGSWFQGDFDLRGVPMALQRLGAPKGFLRLDFEGAEYRESYHGASLDPRTSMWLGLNTPSFRHWFETISDWRRQSAGDRSEVPPYSINDLPDTKLLLPEDLEEGVYLTANVWIGSSETEVVAHLPGVGELPMERTQAGAGEAPKIGADWADPFATQRQLSVARYALRSELGDERNQGFEAFKGSRFGPAPPQPMRSVADRNMHLWRVRLPADLPGGVHTVRVRATDRHGRVDEETMLFEVASKLPPLRFDKDTWFGSQEE
ncbi:MAG: calcineurin-like phosphoesterase C-terminal domain-containing protein [Puniceicoccaceae bacterium]